MLHTPVRVVFGREARLFMNPGDINAGVDVHGSFGRDQRSRIVAQMNLNLGQQFLDRLGKLGQADEPAKTDVVDLMA